MAFEVAGALDEQVYETEWVVSIYELLTGALDVEQVITGNSFAIPVTNGAPKKVLVEPRRFGVWDEFTNTSINDRNYPTDPATTPYYYRCITAGVTGGTEPTWGIGTSATVNDGSVVWILVERIIEPTCHLPIIPTIT